MDGDDIRLLKQLVPRDECGTHFSRAPGCEILAPGDHLHTEGIADPCHRTADVAETQDTERPPGHVITDRLLPSPAPPPALPTLPSPRTPSLPPAMSSPTDCCHPPPRSDVFSATRLRALPRISAQVSSIVGAEV